MTKLLRDELTDKELTLVAAWLANHSRRPRCPWCRSKLWAVEPMLISAPAFRKASVRGKRQVPFVQVSSPCGYTAFFSATTLGIVQVS